LSCRRRDPSVRTRPNLCHPERTRISYYTAPETTLFAAFIKESRMSFGEPIGLNRKSGAVEGSAVSFSSLPRARSPKKPRRNPGGHFTKQVAYISDRSLLSLLLIPNLA
jgi:hypothetical protein